MGYTYVLVLVPRRDLIYGHPVDDFSEEYFPKMIRQLEQEGVYAVDLQSTFLAHKREEPFFRTDTHWNARGTEIAAGYVADYLNKKGIMKKLELDARRRSCKSEYREINSLMFNKQVMDPRKVNVYCGCHYEM